MRNPSFIVRYARKCAILLFRQRSRPVGIYTRINSARSLLLVLRVLLAAWILHVRGHRNHRFTHFHTRGKVAGSTPTFLFVCVRVLFFSFNLRKMNLDRRRVRFAERSTSTNEFDSWRILTEINERLRSLCKLLARNCINIERGLIIID